MVNNIELIQEVQSKLVVMAKLVRIYEDGKIDVDDPGADTVAVDLSQQNKAQIKQKLTKAKVDCITALNQIRVT